jgi:hypothetical protein
METTGVSGENRSIWGETGAFRENLQILPLSPYTLFSLNAPVFPQILLFSPDTPVVFIYSVFSKYSRFFQYPEKTGISGGKREYLEKTEYMETTGVSGENRSIWGENGNI